MKLYMKSLKYNNYFSVIFSLSLILFVAVNVR